MQFSIVQQTATQMGLME